MADGAQAMIHRLDCKVDGSEYALLVSHSAARGDLGLQLRVAATLSLTGRGKVCAELRGLYVKPTHRRQGLARALMLEAEKIVATEFGSETINLVVKAENERAISLYRSLHYSPCYVYPDGDIMMCKRINPDIIAGPLPAKKS